MTPRHARFIWLSGGNTPPPLLTSWLDRQSRARAAGRVALVDARGGPDLDKRVRESAADVVAVIGDECCDATAAWAMRLDADDVVELGHTAGGWQRRLTHLASLALLRREGALRARAAQDFLGERYEPAPSSPTFRPPVLFVGAPGHDQLMAVDALSGWSVAAYAETTRYAEQQLTRAAYDAVILSDAVDQGDLDARLMPLLRADALSTPSFVVIRPRHATFTAAQALASGADEVIVSGSKRDLVQRRLSRAIRAAGLRLALRDEHAFKAALDPVSNRLGHSAFHTYLAAARAAGRFNDQAALIAVVVDGLDAVNRAHGFAAGDRALADAGLVLRRSVRSDDVVGRLDGTSFGLWFADLGEDDLQAMVARLEEGLAPLRADRDGPGLETRIAWTRTRPGDDPIGLTRRGRANARRIECAAGRELASLQSA